jgi:hypothetical protein
LVAYCDSDWATAENDKKVSLDLMCMQISHKSKQQEATAKSSTEAEYIALAAVCSEIMFSKQMLENIGVKTPIKINMDNTGAIMLLENESVSQRTKHMDVRMHFVRDLKEYRIIQVDYVNTKFNHADPHTKNLMNHAYEKLTGMYMKEMDMT